MKALNQWLSKRDTSDPRHKITPPNKNEENVEINVSSSHQNDGSTHVISLQIKMYQTFVS